LGFTFAVADIVIWLVWKEVVPFNFKGATSGKGVLLEKSLLRHKPQKVKNARLAKIILCSEGIENDWRWFDAARRLWRPRRLPDW
jgi:hypothetical protein